MFFIRRIRVTKATTLNKGLFKFLKGFFSNFFCVRLDDFRRFSPSFWSFFIWIGFEYIFSIKRLSFKKQLKYCNLFSSFRQWSRDSTKLICPLLRWRRGRGWQRSIFQTGSLYISIRWDYNTSWKSSSGWTSHCDWWWPR